MIAFFLSPFFQYNYIKFDRSSKIYIILLLILASLVIVLEYFDKEEIVFNNIFIVIFELYIISINVAIFRDILATSKLDSLLDNNNNNNSNCNSNNNSNSCYLVSRRSNKYNKSSSNKNNFPIAKIIFLLLYLRASRYFFCYLQTYIF